MIIPIYSDELFELITLAEIPGNFCEQGRRYRMLPMLEPMSPVFDPDAVPEMVALEIIEVELVVMNHINPRQGSRIQQTYIGLALCHDDLALRIRSAWAPGQKAHAARELRWLGWRLEP